MLGFIIMPTKNFQISNLGLVKEEEPEIKFQHSLNHRENKGFQKNIYLCFIYYAKAFDCMDHNKLWKALKEMGMPDHLTYLLWNLYVGQEATVRTLYGTANWFNIEKEVWQGCLLSPCLFNLYAEYIMRNAWLDELQAEIKICQRNVNNLRYADTTLMAESEEELKSILWRQKRRVKELP